MNQGYAFHIQRNSPDRVSAGAAVGFMYWVLWSTGLVPAVDDWIGLYAARVAVCRCPAFSALHVVVVDLQK